jgi:hypothetical protein
MGVQIGEVCALNPELGTRSLDHNRFAPFLERCRGVTVCRAKQESITSPLKSDTTRKRVA